MAPRFDLVVFDCDGVLVDSEPLVNRVYVELLREEGHALDEETTFREQTGMAMTSRIEVFRTRLGWSPPEGFLATFRERLSVLVGRELRSVEGVLEAVRALEVPFCVASNGSEAEVRERLAATGLGEAFGRHVFSAADAGRPKPFPDVFLRAARAMGAAPARTAVIEDSTAGVEAAVAAGMAAFGYAARTEAAALERRGARTFTHMNALPALLGT